MKKFTLFLMSMFLFLGTTIAQNYRLTGTAISSDELNAKTAPTHIAIKNLSATNNFYFVGNTGAAPYSAAEFSDAAVFVWQPVEEGVAGSYYLMKLDGTYMQATSPADFGTVDGAAVFTSSNPTTTGVGSTKFNGDGDSQAYIDDEALLVRFMNSAAGNWLNVQNGDAGTPLYNTGRGGWTIHYVYAVEAPVVEAEPEVPAEGELVLNLTAEQIGEAPYQLSDEEAAKVFALSDLTIAVKVNTPADMSGRCALFCTSDPTQAANTSAMGMNSAYVAYGTNNATTGYLASCKAGDRLTAGNVPTATEGVVLVYVINPTNNLCQLYIDGTLAREWNNVHADGFMVGYEIATPQMVKADHADANIYIGGGMTAEGAFEVFGGAVTGVEVYNGALTAEEIANVFAEPEIETFAVTAELYPAVEGDITEIKTIRIQHNEGPTLSDFPTGWTLTNEAGESFPMSFDWGLNNWDDIFVYVNPAITAAGTYTLTIPAGSLKTDGGKECEAAEFSWTVVGSVEPLVKVSTDETRYYYKIASFNRGGYLTSVVGKVQHVDETFASYWYFTKADDNGGVYFHNYTTEQTLGADRAMSDTPAVWYVLPNGVNEEGYAISSTNPISNGSCIDANNWSTGVGSWTPSANDWQGTTWVFSEVDVDAMIAELQAARDAFDAAYAEAQNILTEANLNIATMAVALQTTDENAAGYVWANTYAYGDEGVTAYLVDGDINTFFHTNWDNYATDGTKDYLEVDLGEGNSISEFCINYVTRHNGSTDFPTSVTLLGSNDKSEYTEIATISEGLPVGNSKSYTSPVMGNGNAYRYIRYQVNSTSRGNATIPYFHLAEFGISTATVSIAEKYAEVVAQISALEVIAEQLANNAEYSKEQLVAATTTLYAALKAIEEGFTTRPEIETFAVTASLFPTVDGDVTEIKGIRVEAGQGPALAELPTIWTLTNEAGEVFATSIDWLYNFETVLVMVNPSITAAGTYTLTIPAGSLKTDDGKECEAATFSWTIVNNYKPGDINKDGNITISDVVLTVNALMGNTSDESVLNAADMNGDGKITISDVVSVVNALLNYKKQESAPIRVASRYSVDTDELHVSDASINGNEATMTVKLDNADRYNAMQFDLNLPDGVSIKNVTMNSNHTVAYNDCRIVAYSLKNRAFGAQEDIMSITLNVEDKVEYAEVTFDNILVTTTELDEQRLNAVGTRIDGTTGIVDNVESTTRIYTQNNCIVIETANVDVAEIVTANGIVNKAAVTAGKNCIAIEHKGLYVVKVGNKATKVVF